MTALLCLDLLGAKARWRQGGPAAVTALFEDFADLVLDTAASLDVSAQLLGEIDGDTCSIQCPTAESALALGRRIFRRAWLEARTPEDLRLWMRGVVVPCTANGSRRNFETDEEVGGIRRVLAPDDMMKARAVLVSGFRGMRLLVDETLLSDQLRGQFRVPLGRLGVIPFRRMNFTPYPPGLRRTLQDFLWMAETAHEWHNYTMRMKQRSLWSANDSAEFSQAAATQVVFHEVDAILQSVMRKNQAKEHGARAPGQSNEAESAEG